MAEPLIVPAVLRPWLKSGLSALLLENPERAEALRVTARQPVPTNKSRPAPSVTPAVGAASSTSTAAPTTPPRAFGGSPFTAPQKNTASPKTGPAPVSSGDAPFVPAPAVERNTSAAVTLPLSAWPAPWLALKNRRPLPPRPLVFWTYAGLGDDLMGTADPQRQQAIVQLLSALHHPGGTHVFWPYSLPAAPLSADGPSLFWSGVEWLKPRVILVFGSEARDALGLPKSLLPFSQDRLDGRMVVQLHQPSSLVEAVEATGGDAMRRAIAFLSRLLSFCAQQ